MFGGGHVVLPLLENEFVPQGLISPDSFITGYAAAQAVPGPLFTFSSYIGMSIEVLEEEFWLLSLYSYQHFYYYLECYHFGMILNLTLMLKVLKGISAGVVGILIAAFYNPIWASTIKSELDFVLASSLFVFLVYYKLPSWSIVLIGIIIGIMFY